MKSMLWLSAALAAVQIASAASCSKAYTVVSGDYCDKIGTQFGITFAQLRNWNPSINSACTNLSIGQVLCVAESTSTSSTSTFTSSQPTPSGTPGCTFYTIKPGDSCGYIKGKFGITIQEIYEYNPTFYNCNKISSYVGKQICVTKPANKYAFGYPVFQGGQTLVSEKTVVIKDAKDFCSFMPPAPGDLVAPTEQQALVQCTSSSVAPGAKTFPSGYIKTANFYNNTVANYVQITGTIDITKWNMSSSDQGGQYDFTGSPKLAECAGYNSFVSLIEPNVPDFCIRCCQSPGDCPTGISTYGCAVIVPGTY
ncbi:hypothetical protein BZG36_03445 [Bifiguratus adelaidae]|uniref:LysM domain-containing protein n=1 Tax=Bifiguratus adelaidae TaxID=1938954 RepID=A0A261XXX8_9FUNG|nr:hypothetical protein BZG36_03445 [Bifiguratus adelaidae]